MHQPPPPDERCNCTFSKSFAKSIAMVAATGSSGAFHLQRYIPQSAVVPFSVRRSRVADESFRVFEFPENERSQPLPQPDVVKSSLEPQRTDSGQQHVLSTFSNGGNFGCTMSAPTRVFACNVTLSRKDVIPGTRPTWTNIGANTNKSVARNFLLEKIFALSLRC